MTRRSTIVIVGMSHSILYGPGPGDDLLDTGLPVTPLDDLPAKAAEPEPEYRRFRDRQHPTSPRQRGGR